MPNSIVKIPKALNEPVLNYSPGSPEKAEIKKALKEFKSSNFDIAMVIDGKKVTTDKQIDIRPPHEIAHKLGHYHKGDASHVHQAINAALKAKQAWEDMPWEHRAAIFLKAADLLSGPYRARMNAATMLCQSKNIYQAEIDSVAELCDFFRFNAQYMQEIYHQQPESPKGQWNQLEHRPLEGFVFALTPFNFTSIAGNLPAAPAMLGNVVVWKPANTQILSAMVIDNFL